MSLHRSTGKQVESLALVALFLMTLAGRALAQSCSVPATHTTIQDAIDDPACVEIALADQPYTESIAIPRSLTLFGPRPGNAVVEGLVQVVGASTQVTLQDLRVENGCPRQAMSASGGAAVSSIGIEVVHSTILPCPHWIFGDSFETGDLIAWSSASAP